MVVYLSDMAILDQNNVTGRNGEWKRLIFAMTHAQRNLCCPGYQHDGSQSAVCHLANDIILL